MSTRLPQPPNAGEKFRIFCESLGGKAQYSPLRWVTPNGIFIGRWNGWCKLRGRVSPENLERVARFIEENRDLLFYETPASWEFKWSPKGKYFPNTVVRYSGGPLRLGDGIRIEVEGEERIKQGGKVAGEFAGMAPRECKVEGKYEDFVLVGCEAPGEGDLVSKTLEIFKKFRDTKIKVNRAIRERVG